MINDIIKYANGEFFKASTKHINPYRKQTVLNRITGVKIKQEVKNCAESCDFDIILSYQAICTLSFKNSADVVSGSVKNTNLVNDYISRSDSDRLHESAFTFTFLKAILTLNTDEDVKEDNTSKEQEDNTSKESDIYDFLNDIFNKHAVKEKPVKNTDSFSKVFSDVLTRIGEAFEAEAMDSNKEVLKDGPIPDLDKRTPSEIKPEYEIKPESEVKSESVNRVATKERDADTMDFEDATFELKHGKLLGRKAWIKNLCFSLESSYVVLGENGIPSTYAIPVRGDEEINYTPNLKSLFKVTSAPNAMNKDILVETYTINSEDFLAEDWYIVE